MEFKFLKKYWQIFWQLQKIDFMRRIAYPVSFGVSCVAVLLTMLLSILFINVNFRYIQNLAGWSYYQVLAVVGTYMIIEGLMWVLFAQLNAVNVHIKEGTMDGILLKPIDDQFLVSFWRGDFEDIVRVFTGTVLIVISIINTTGFKLGQIALFCLMLFDGLVILYSFNLMIRSISFWIVDGSGLWLLMERVTSNSQYPTDIYYHKIVRSFLTFVIPLAFVATVPAQILTGAVINWQFVLFSLIITFIFFSVARKFWKFSLNHYSSASS